MKKGIQRVKFEKSECGGGTVAWEMGVLPPKKIRSREEKGIGAKKGGRLRQRRSQKEGGLRLSSKARLKAM